VIFKKRLIVDPTAAIFSALSTFFPIFFVFSPSLRLSMYIMQTNKKKSVHHSIEMNSYSTFQKKKSKKLAILNSVLASASCQNRILVLYVDNNKKMSKKSRIIISEEQIVYNLIFKIADRMKQQGFEEDIGYNPIVSSLKSEGSSRDAGSFSEYSLQGSVKDEFVDDVKNRLRGLCDNVEAEPFIGKK